MYKSLLIYSVNKKTLLMREVISSLDDKRTYHSRQAVNILQLLHYLMVEESDHHTSINLPLRLTAHQIYNHFKRLKVSINRVLVVAE